mmetsp:Transcript_3312/g.3930  ORF Transcript_3312/g.3930 Transcript_3312/m.3930 type:complete len:145 (+) Transcript_3312:67-501(+)
MKENNLVGTLKTSMSELKHLVHVDLRYNELKGQGLNGCIDQNRFCGANVAVCKLGENICDQKEDEVETETNPPSTSVETSSPTDSTSLPPSSTTSADDLNIVSNKATVGEKLTALVMITLLLFPCCLSMFALQMNQNQEYHDTI